MTTYQSLLNEIISIVHPYALDDMLITLTTDVINRYLRSHLENIKGAVDYHATIILISSVISRHFGIRLCATEFITMAEDREKLYHIFATWRSMLLAETDVQNQNSTDCLAHKV